MRRGLPYPLGLKHLSLYMQKRHPSLGLKIAPGPRVVSSFGLCCETVLFFDSKADLFGDFASVTHLEDKSIDYRLLRSFSSLYAITDYVRISRAKLGQMITLPSGRLTLPLG